MSMSIKYNRRGGNVRHNVGCRTRNLDAIFVARRKCLPVVLVIARIILNVIVRQMPLNVR
jgi:hypothetical protein